MSAIIPPAPANYPDILGLITQQNRLNMDVIQCALAIRPHQIAAGQNFEVLVLLQNASDIDVDVNLHLNLPQKDAGGKGSMFYSKSSHPLVGLQPAEVGYVILPVSCSPKTQPSTYSLSIDVRVERMDKTHKPTRIRAKEGGGEVIMDAVSEKCRRQLLILRMARWGIEHGGKINHIEANFQITPPQLATLVEFNAGWESLWTMSDHVDENILKDRVQEQLNLFLPQLTKDNMLTPLLEATNTWFTKCGYPLHPSEAIYLTKILTLVLCEVGVEQPSRINPNPILPNWYTEAMKHFLHEPRLANIPVALMKETLYPDLVYDTILHSFKMITTVLSENFGTAEEIASYANTIRTTLRKNDQLNYGQVYLPLIAAGIIANSRITFANENIRDSLFEMSHTHEKRANELDDDNRFIADIIKKLVDRYLDYVAAL